MDKLKQLIERDQWAELLVDAKTISQHSKNSEIEILAFSETEALKKGTEIFGVSKDNLELKKIARGYTGFMGWFRIPSRYILAIKESVLNNMTQTENYTHYNELAQNQDGSFNILMRKKGLTLQVFPPKGLGRAVSSSQIMTELENRGFRNIHPELISKALQHLKQPIVIAPYIATITDSKFHVSVEKDNMSAILKFTPPQDHLGRIPEVSEIVSELNSKNVIHGINTKYISDALENELYNLPIVVAEGTPVVQGANGYIEYLFPTNKDNVMHAIRKDGSIDFKELNIIHNVKENEVIAIIHKETAGQNGCTVTNEKIPAIPGNPVEYNLGDNVTLSSDKTKIIATITGQVNLKGTQICVDQAFEVSSDVDLSVGNIDFIGNVVIKGNVTDGFSVISGGNIEIFGHIGKCVIQAEGNIVAHQGIQGNDEAHIQCKGDLFARFIERSNLVIGGNLIVIKSVLHSNVVCEQGVYVTGDKKAIIAGGNIQAKTEIYAKQIGAESYIKTSLEVAYSQQLLSEIDALTTAHAEQEQEIADIKNDLSMKAERMGANLLVQYEQKITKLEMQKTKTDHLLTNAKGLLNQLENSSNISFEKSIMPGVKVKIGNAFLDITTIQTKGTLIKLDDHIKITNYQISEILQTFTKKQQNLKKRH